MNESFIMGCVASTLQFIVAGYALRLNRRFGTARVGWSLFSAFSLLALLQLIQSTAPFDANTNSAVEINVTYALISFLLLVGMIHMETMLKERLRVERLEQQLRAGLETEVKTKTAHLTRAIDELMREIEESKRLATIIETSHWRKSGKTAEDVSASVTHPATMPGVSPVRETTGKPTAMPQPAERDSTGETSFGWQPDSALARPYLT
jgi:hypothetical protein